MMGRVFRDLHLLMRYRIIPVYGLITLIYMIMLSYLPQKFYGQLIPLLIWSDPAMLGFFFMGAVVLYEKLEGTLQYSAITPLSGQAYLFGKVTSLALLSLVASSLIALQGPLSLFKFIFLSVGVMGNAIFFSLVGFIAASYFKTVNGYMLGAVGYTIFFLLPIVRHVGLVNHWGLILYPFNGFMEFIWYPYQGGETLLLFISGLQILILIIVSWKIALVRYQKLNQEVSNG